MLAALARSLSSSASAPALPARAEPSSPPPRYEGASLGLAEAGAGSLRSPRSVKREARAGAGAARGARGLARVPGERGLGEPGPRRCRPAPAWLAPRLNPESGPPLPLRGILDHDSRCIL